MKRMHRHRQTGMVISLLIFWLLLVSGLILLSLRSSPAEQAWQQQNSQLKQLEWVAQQLWLFSQQTPQIYATDTNGRFYDGDRVPSPGYFPCPDTNGNGQSNTPCGQGRETVIGWLPKKMATRSINFTPYHQPPFTILLAVDSRYVIQNSDYNNPPIQRFAPLNPDQPGQASLIDRQGQQSVAILFIMPNSWGNPDHINTLFSSWQDTLSQTPEQPDRQAFDQLFPIQLALTLNEWQQRITDSLVPIAPVLCQGSPTQPHWFNACSNPQQPSHLCPDAGWSNPTGSQWREKLCPPSE